jgi:multidrug efflux pump
MVLGFVSEDGSMKQADIGDYVAASVIDPISRVEGVGDVTNFGSQYAMRIWLDAAKLQSYQLTPADVSAPSRRRIPKSRPVNWAACLPSPASS